MNIHDPKHPLWPLLRLAIIAGALLLFSWLNATKFDSTEIAMIVQTLFAAAGVEGLTKTFTRSGGG